MGVDKNLFLYDFAIVSIMKNAAPYVKEWINYYLLAGVDHFFIYDNDSEDNFKEVLQPYVDAGLVTYIFYPGKHKMLEAYTDAINEFKFECRYMACIDDDEFILPKSKPTIPEVADEILADNPMAAALSMHWQFYGSNYQEKADYNRGVLDRFTKRSDKVDNMVKTLLNPRLTRHFVDPHNAIYFFTCNAVNENRQIVIGSVDQNPPTNDKIVVNHYHTKSLEEFILRKSLTDANFGYTFTKEVIEERFRKVNEGTNNVFDDDILKYRDERRKALTQNGGGIDELSTFAKLKQINSNKLLAALSSNLLAGFVIDDAEKFFDSHKNRFYYFKMLANFLETAPKEFFKNKAETFLTCFSLSSFLKERFIDKELGKMFEEFSLHAVGQSFAAGFSIPDFQLLVKELPQILKLPYPVSNGIRSMYFEIMPKITEILRSLVTAPGYMYIFADIHEFKYIMEMLKVFDQYNHK